MNDREAVIRKRERILERKTQRAPKVELAIARHTFSPLSIPKSHPASKSLHLEPDLRYAAAAS